MTHSLVLFVGDVTEYLCIAAKNFDSSAYLIDSNNVTGQHQGTAYVSIGDMLSLDDFFNVLSTATKIIYCPPKIWSDRKTSRDLFSAAWLSEHCVRLVSNLYNVPTENVPIKITGVDSPKPRASELKQLWVAGCSTTFGTGVNRGQRFQDIIKESLGLESTDLSCPGSSISWSRDQILKSDIKKNDIVVWGITSKNRFTWFDGVKISHINSTHYTEHPEFDKVVPLPLLDSSQRTYEAISAVQQVNNFCDKVGAHLIFANIHSDIDLLADFAKYKGFVMINIPKNLDDPNIFLDLGADQMHPGPKTHQYYAEMILKKINSLNIGT